VLTRAQNLADKLNVTVTPLYVVGYNGISGAPEDLIAQLTEHVEEIRKSGCDVC
jgi:protein-disulfide isomerase